MPSGWAYAFDCGGPRRERPLATTNRQVRPSRRCDGDAVIGASPAGGEVRHRIRGAPRREIAVSAPAAARRNPSKCARDLGVRPAQALVSAGLRCLLVASCETAPSKRDQVRFHLTTGMLPGRPNGRERTPLARSHNRSSFRNSSRTSNATSRSRIGGMGPAVSRAVR